MYTLEEFDKQKTKVMNYILYKKRSEQETRKKFENIIEPELLDDILEYVKEAGYLNDKDYIKKAIQEYKALKNLSIKEIEYKLVTKGIKRQDIEDYFSENKEELTEYEIRSAYNLILKKSEKKEEEVIRYLMQKGYSSDNIRKAIQKLEEEETK